MHKNLLYLFAFYFLCSCHDNAGDSFIEDDDKTVISDTTEYDRQNIVQNSWTYAQMRKHYLWEEHLPDSASLKYKDRAELFFSRLKYKDDRFSWIERNKDYRGASLFDRFGLETVDYLLPTGKKVHRTALVMPRSSAETAGLRRGDWFVILNADADRMEVETGEIDGTDFLPGKKIVLLSDSKSYTAAVSLDTIYRIRDKKIGYLVYNSFLDGLDGLSYPYRTELKNIFGNFRNEGITDLIIDLRYNHGGYVSIELLMCSLILPDEFLGEKGGFQSYNRHIAAELLKQTGNEEEILYFPDKHAVGENNVGLRKVYFIITGRSASASESLINSLAPCISVVTVGATSTGKNVGSYTLKDNQLEWQLQPITFYYFNREHQAVPGTGIIPDIAFNENEIATWHEWGDTNEMLLNVTISQIVEDNLERRSASDYGKLQLTPVANEELPRRKVEGLLTNKE